MKAIKGRELIGIIVAFTLVLTGCQSSDNNTDNDTMQNTIVILKFKTQPDKGAKTISELTGLIEKVKLEPNFVEIKLHVDSKDNTNILLYEEWENENYYKTKHMETDHMQDFMTKSRNFLTGPPEITFWKIEKEFE